MSDGELRPRLTVEALDAAEDREALHDLVRGRTYNNVLLDVLEMLRETRAAIGHREEELEELRREVKDLRVVARLVDPAPLPHEVEAAMELNAANESPGWWSRFARSEAVLVQGWLFAVVHVFREELVLDLVNRDRGVLPEAGEVVTVKGLHFEVKHFRRDDTDRRLLRLEPK